MDGHDSVSRDAARWLQAGLLDLEFYSALRGLELPDPESAARDFVRHGMKQRLSPHPFLDFASLPPDTRRAWRQGRAGQVLDDLTDEHGHVRTVGPLAEAPDPASARTHLLALAEQLGREPVEPASPDPAVVDWRAVEREVRRHPGRTSVVILAAEVGRTVRAVNRILQQTAAHDVELVVVDRGSKPHVALGLHAALRESTQVELMRHPGTVSATSATNLGLARVTGDTVALLQSHVLVRRGWLAPLLAALDDPGVAGAQPLVLRPDDTIECAGMLVIAEGRGPVPLLGGHPKEDALRLADRRLAATSPEAMALRTHDVVAVGGLQPRATWTEATLDLCARLLQLRPAGFRLAPGALVTSTRAQGRRGARQMPPHPLLPADPDLYERIGFVAERPDPPTTDPVITVRRDRADQLRWSLKLPSPAGQQGDLWGDTHLADALAEALRGLGQDVVTRRRGAYDAGPGHLDDVSLALRGLYPIPPTPGQLNVLWVISHPDDVDPREFDGYDLVCAASMPWSRELSARTGREVLPLLQATGFRRPTSAPASPREPGVVFVGTALTGRDRPLVRMALEAGVELAVYGPGWEHLPPGVWRGAYVDNARIPDLYHRHGIVLADHWPDMARHGFIANRVFDAVASGARVICDDVVGVHEVFDPRDVVVVRTPEQIAAAVAELNRTARAADVPRPEVAFHDRARTLVARVFRAASQSRGGNGRR